jgi:hypothetical protein
MTPKEIKLLKDKINSDQRDIVLEGLEELRTYGTVDFLNDIIFVLKFNEDEKVIDAVIKFLKDIKEQEAVPYFISWLENKDLKKLREHLLSVCWQTKLDFSDYLEFYTDIVIREDYLNAFEAFTVIENSMDNIKEEDRVRCMAKLKEKTPELDEEKRKLGYELISLIG